MGAGWKHLCQILNITLTYHNDMTVRDFSKICITFVIQQTLWIIFVSLQSADPSKVKVSGPAIEAPVTASRTTFLLVDCKQAGTGENTSVVHRP